MADAVPAIPLAVQAPQIENPAVQQTQYAQAASLQQQTQQRIQAVRDQAAINAALQASNGDPDQAAAALDQSGSGTAAMALRQNTMAYRKQLGEQMDAQLTRQEKELGFASQMISSLGENPDPDTYSLIRGALLSSTANDPQGSKLLATVMAPNATPDQIPDIANRLTAMVTPMKDQIATRRQAFNDVLAGKYNSAIAGWLTSSGPEDWPKILPFARQMIAGQDGPAAADAAIAPFALAIQQGGDPVALKQRIQQLGMTQAARDKMNEPMNVNGNVVIPAQLQPGAGPSASGQPQPGVLFSAPIKRTLNETMTVDGKPSPVWTDEFGNVTDVGGNAIDPKRIGARPPASVIVQNMKEGEGSAADPKVVQAWVTQLKDPQSGVTLTQVPTALRSAVVSQLQPGEITKLTAQDQAMMNLALKTIPSIDRVEQMAQQINSMGLMGTVGANWKKLVSGQSVATAISGLTPQQQQLVGQFVTESGLITSGVARVHGGARGGGSPQMQAILAPILEPGSSTLDVYLGHLEGARDFMNTYAAPPDRTGVSGPHTPSSTPTTKTLYAGSTPIVLTKQADGTWTSPSGGVYDDTGKRIR